MSFLFKQPKLPSIVTPRPSLPAPPPIERIVKEEEKKKAKARIGRRGKTIATSPRGILTKAPVERKYLLGE